MLKTISDQPSSEQTAKLHALLRESESLANQINAPVVSLSIATTIEILSSLGVNNLANFLFGRCDRKTNFS